MTQTLFGKLDEIAIDRLRTFEPPEGYRLAFSGGKDSIVLHHIAERSGVKFEAVYSVCPDPPEVMRFMKANYPGLKWETHPWGLFERVVQHHAPPTRKARWCCREFKETSTDPRITLTGIRWAESARRSGRAMVEFCTKGYSRRLLHPLIDWEDRDVWEYIRMHKIEYCILYDPPYRRKRIGCVGCPMDRDPRWRVLWPHIAESWRRAFVKIYATVPKVRARWSSGDAYFEAWCDRDNPMHGDLAEDDCGLFI